VKQIRQRLTYANVMSSIAVFFILGGATAFAATKIGSGQLKANSVLTGKIKKEAVTEGKIKNGAITTSKIADKAVTGAKIDPVGLGIVPNATNATNAINAQNAQNAQNANSVGGQVIRKFSYISNTTANKTTLLSLNGLTLTAGCAAGAVTAVANTSVQDSLIHSGGSILATEKSFYNEDDNFDIGNNFSILATAEADSNQGTFTYTTPAGAVVTATFQSEEDALGADCSVSGYALG
jgi:hypothetical protein